MPAMQSSGVLPSSDMLHSFDSHTLQYHASHEVRLRRCLLHDGLLYLVFEGILVQVQLFNLAEQPRYLFHLHGVPRRHLTSLTVLTTLLAPLPSLYKFLKVTSFGLQLLIHLQTFLVDSFVFLFFSNESGTDATFCFVADLSVGNHRRLVVLNHHCWPFLLTMFQF